MANEPGPSDQATKTWPAQRIILVVEDEANIRNLIARTLRAEGYTVLEAPNGSAALELCAGHPNPILLMITDLGLPLMNGAELIDRAGPLRPDMKILCLSGRDVAQYPPGVMRLPKPFTLKGLLFIVREALEDRPRKDHG